MPRIALLVALACAAVSCKERNPEYCDSSADCPSGSACRTTADAGLVHVCVPADAPLAGDGGGPNADGGVRCSDGGSCPAELPICRADNVCQRCRPTTADCQASQPVCSDAGTCGRCSQSSQCAARDAGTAFCELDAGACVECQSSDTCPMARPVCAAGACRTCILDSECSTFCDSGLCVPPNDVLHVLKTATASDCTAAAPCPTVGAALAKTTAGKRWWITIGDGIYAESLTIADRDVVLVGVTGTQLEPSFTDSPTVSVTGTSSVWLRKVEIAGGSPGVQCAGATTAGTTLQISDAKVSGTAGNGVDAGQCTLTVERTLIQASTLIGLSIGAGCAFNVHDSVVEDGLSSGVSITQPAAGGVFNENTVTRNLQGGVVCQSVTPTIAFKNDVVYGNGSPQVFGTGCTWSFSDIGPGGAPDGDGNLSVEPGFTSPTDYHLTTTSMCVNAGDPSTPPSIDIDGDPRPIHSRIDIGADEVP